MNQPNYLSAQRKQWALTKQDLAGLLGYRNRDQVSRCETSLRRPTLRLALGCQVIFGLPPSEMFPLVYAEIEDQVLAQAAALDLDLRGRDDPTAERKRQLLRDMVVRVERALLP